MLQAIDTLGELETELAALSALLRLAALLGADPIAPAVALTTREAEGMAAILDLLQGQAEAARGTLEGLAFAKTG